MTQSANPIQNKSESSSCGRNHTLLAVRLCLILLVPFLGLAAVGHIDGESSEFRGLTPFLLFWSLALLILGLALWKVVELIRNKGLCCCVKGRSLVAAALCLIPWACIFTGYALSPGFLVPFYNNRFVMVVLCTVALWQAIGFILLIRAKSPMQSFLVLLFFILSANFVLVFSPLIGPALITIVNAFCQTSK